MRGDHAASSLRNLLEEAQRLLGAATEDLDRRAGGRPEEDVEPVRKVLSRVGRLLGEGAASLAAAAETAVSATAREAAQRQIQAVLEITRSLAHVREVDALFELIMDLVIQHSKAERGFLVIAEPGEETRFRAARNIDHETIHEAEREISRSVIDQVLSSGEPLLVRNALADQSLGLQESVVSLGILSVLAAPITLHGKVQGVVYLESRSVQGLFNEEDLAFLRLFCEQSALALENARAYEQAREAETRLAEENRQLRTELVQRHSYQGIIGRSPRMQSVYQLMERVAVTPISVLVRGENGTGKEKVARVIHYNSPRANGPFVTVNCAAIPETLIESELFGIEKGTATGVDARPGKFQVADGGTLFLDEIGDMSLVTQAKLLRVLQEREIERVGGRKSIRVDVRIIAATNTDLENAIREKRFREDLYYRLNVVSVILPALRDRAEDIPLLIAHFLERLGEELGMPHKCLSGEAVDCLCRYSWPGNVRELENVISRCLVLSDDPEIGVDLLPAKIREAGLGDGPRMRVGEATLVDLERAALCDALEKHGWVQTRAASALGLSERKLRYRMKKLGIRRPDGRNGPP